MYEHAADAHPYRDERALPIWHIERGWSLFVGPLGRNASHAHSVPVYVTGVYAPFRIRIDGGAWTTCRAAVIPAGVAYEFDVEGQPLAVLYLEPTVGGVASLVPLLAGASDTYGVILSAEAPPPVMRDLFEARDGCKRVGETIDDLLQFAKPRARRDPDMRVARAVATLSLDHEDAQYVTDVARDVGLSVSRFQHLFADEVGVPFRRFRVWQRLRSAIGEVTRGGSFTTAAHSAGFFDQAHFSRAFRTAFGAPPSPSLRQVRRA